VNFLKKRGGNVPKGMTQPKDCRMDYNIYWAAGNPAVGAQFIEKQRKQGIEQNSISADPLFVAIEGEDFRFCDGSPALALGIKPIDMALIGLTAGFPQKYRGKGMTEADKAPRPWRENQTQTDTEMNDIP